MLAFFHSQTKTCSKNTSIPIAKKVSESDGWVGRALRVRRGSQAYISGFVRRASGLERT
jgi:hypothetical protein